MKTLKISDNGRYLEKSDNTPFFWLGDTAWELFHKLNKKDAEFYLKTRASQKFNVVQAVLLAEFDGLNTPNAYGRTPLKKDSSDNYSPLLPDTDGDYSYWDHVDYIISQAQELKLYIGLLPTWGDKYNLKWGVGPEIFNSENAYFYGEWLGERYCKYDNIIWILGGDRPLETEKHFAITDALAKGLHDGGNGKFLMTFHPNGGTSSSEFVHERNWLDFNMIQSGHRTGRDICFKKVTEDYLREPVKPVLDGEPNYEDHPIDFKPENGYFNGFDSRRAMYQNAFSGACGNTYGHHSVWSFLTDLNEYKIFPEGYFITNWKTALHRPGAESVKYFAELISKYPLCYCKPDDKLVKNNIDDKNHIACISCNEYSLIYVPNSRIIELNDNNYTEYIEFNPSNGSCTSSMKLSNTIESSQGNSDIIYILKRG